MDELVYFADIERIQNYVRAWGRVDMRKWWEEEARPFFDSILLDTGRIVRQEVKQNEYPGLTSTVIVFLWLQTDEVSMLLDVNDIRVVAVLFQNDKVQWMGDDIDPNYFVLDESYRCAGLFAPDFLTFVKRETSEPTVTAFVDDELEPLLMQVDIPIITRQISESTDEFARFLHLVEQLHAELQ